MKNILTALGNENVNEKLKTYKNIKVLMKDIQYKEGILEILDEKKEIDWIIISELLPGEIELNNLIQKIQQKNNRINIIIILDTFKEEVENKLKENKNLYIYYNNQIKIKDVVELINNNNNNTKLKEEIKKLNKIIETKNIQLKNKEEEERVEQEIENKYGEKNRIIKLINKQKYTNKQEGKIIGVSGVNGVGKSVFVVNIAKTLQRDKKKTLIVDLDIFNNSIEMLFGIKKNNYILEEAIEEYEMNETNNISNEIIKVNKYIQILSGKDLIYKNNRINENEFIKIIKEQKNNYDAIIIDTSFELNFNYAKAIMKESDKIIFLSEANIMQIKKTKNILKIYLKNWEIKKQKINIIFNKIKEDSIDDEILKEIFKEYKILGEVNYIQHCNTMINNNMKNIFIKRKIKNQYNKLQKKIFMNEKLKIYYMNKIKK